MSTRIVITGAAGFLGQQVIRRLVSQRSTAKITASDLVPVAGQQPNVTGLTCQLDDPVLLGAVARADIVIHLAATLGGAAEADPQAAQRINLDATLGLIAACRPGTRFVFASSLAVLGDSSDARAPVMVYGAHKAMAEIAIETATRRGEIDGISLRPGGIVARRDHNPNLKSAFLSQVFWAIAEGADMTLPVSPEAETWLSSVHRVAEQFVAAALAPKLTGARSVTLPMLKCRISDLVEALKAAFPHSPSTIAFAPDPDVMRLFGQAQPIDFKDGLLAGFTSDADLTALVRAALTSGDTP